MSGVVKSIEIDGDSLNGSLLTDDTDDTYQEPEGTPEPEDPEARLDWGRKHDGEDWYRREVASREAARNARYAEQERERVELEKVDEIRKLQGTNPWEYERRMRERNLQLHGFTKAQIEKSNQPLPDEVIKSNLEEFSVLRKGKALQAATTNNALRPQKQKTRRTARDRTVSDTKRAVSTLAEALVDERTFNMPNVKKHHKTKQMSMAKRASRRIADEPVEYGIFAAQPAAPVPESLQRNPSTRKKNSADPRNHAPFKKPTSAIAAKPQGISKSSRDGTRRSRLGKRSGG